MAKLRLKAGFLCARIGVEEWRLVHVGPIEVLFDYVGVMQVLRAFHFRSCSQT